MEYEHKFFVGHRPFWPNVVGGENAKFLDGKTFESGFDVLGIDILPFFGDDHVFLAAGELQVASPVETAKVAGQEPAVDDGFRREFRFIQIARHDGLASNGDFANAVGSGIYDANFHPRQRLAYGVRAKWFQIVDRNGGASFRESVSVSDRNTEIVEKLQRLRFGESAADKDGAEFSAKRFMDLLEHAAADFETRPAFGERLVDSNERVKNFTLARWQRVEARLQTFLQVFQNEWNETHISYFVFRKSFAHVFRTQRAQMHDRCAARKRSEKTNHEIDGMVCWKDTEVAHARPERINRCERDALLQIIFVRHHAALGAAACPGGVDNARGVLAFARDEYRLVFSAKIFPAPRAGEIGICRCFRHQHGSHVRRGSASSRGAELAPDRIFRDQQGSVRMLEQLPLFVRREFVIQGNKNAASKKNGIRRNQPLRLIRHDDAGASACGEAAFLQSSRKGMRAFLEVAISQALFLALAVRFDQAHLVRILNQCIPQRFADGMIFRKVQHYRRD